MQQGTRICLGAEWDNDDGAGHDRGGGAAGPDFGVMPGCRAPVGMILRGLLGYVLRSFKLRQENPACHFLQEMLFFQPVHDGAFDL